MPHDLPVALVSGLSLDSIVVRSILVTPLNLDIGSKVWWPGRLARQARPDVDLMGELETVGSAMGWTATGAPG